MSDLKQNGRTNTLIDAKKSIEETLAEWLNRFGFTMSELDNVANKP